MTMPTTNTSKISWNKLDKEGISKRIQLLLDKIAQHLGDQAYIYQLSYGFGNSIYKNGALTLPKNLSSDEIREIQYDLLEYSKDPLGLITKGYLEVHINHREEEVSASIIPLKRINSGNFLGTFGTADFLASQENSSGTDWNVSAGSEYFLPVLPNLWHSEYGDELVSLIGLKNYGGINKNLKYTLHKHFINNFNDFMNYPTTIVFFPKQWFVGETDCFLRFQKEILQLCWVQSKDYRLDNTEFNRANALLYNEINITRSTIPYLQPFPRAIEQAINSEQLVFKPISSGQNEALHKLEDYINTQLKSSKNKELKKFGFKIYEFDYLNGNENDWGFLSLSTMHFPNQIGGNSVRSHKKDQYFKRIIKEMKINNKNEYSCTPYIRFKDEEYSKHPIANIVTSQKEIKHLDYGQFTSYLLFKNFENV